MEKKFIGQDKIRTTRKALDFWYKNCRNIITLKEFILDCKRIDDKIIIYNSSKII